MHSDFPLVHKGLYEIQTRLQIFGRSICPLGSEIEAHLHSLTLDLCEMKGAKRRHIVLFSLDFGVPPKVICRVYDSRLYEAALGIMLPLLPFVGATTLKMEDCSPKPKR